MVLPAPVAEQPEVVFSAYGQHILSCPGWLGGKDWEAGAYSPLTVGGCRGCWAR